jgi:hypothetical protein
VNVCGVVPTVFFALIVIVITPPVFAAGVPLRVAVPFPLSTKVTPAGSAPVSLSDGVGVPEVVTANVPAAPTVKVALFTLVNTGARFTVSVKLCGVVATAFVAWMVIG